MTTRTRLAALVLSAALTAAACGDDDSTDPPDDTSAAPADATADETPVADGPSVLAAFDPGLGELPEGIAVAPDGTVYVGLAPQGRIVSIADDGTVTDVASIELAEGDLGVLGIHASDDALLAAVFSASDEIRGVWRVDLASGATERIVDGRIGLPNSIAADGDLTLITDSIGPNGTGAVWRLGDDGEAEVWAESDLLGGDSSFGFPFPIGANGIGIHDGAAYVAVTETARVVRIPINPDGTAGEAELFADLSASGPDGIARVPDGLAVDSEGVFVTVLTTHEVIALDPGDASVDVLASAEDRLDAPAGVALRDDALFVTSFSAAIEALTNGQGPSVVRIPR